jgi:hypothetical protein
LQINFYKKKKSAKVKVTTVPYRPGQVFRPQEVPAVIFTKQLATLPALLTHPL